MVEVSVRGRIDGACDGKNAWDDFIRSRAPHILDVFILHVKEQNSTDMAELRAKMDALFEYLHNPVCQKGFEDSIRQFLKGEKSQLKHLFTHKAQCTCPMGIEPDQWDCIMKYWIDEKMIAKASTMFNVQGNQKQPSKYGRVGKASAEATIVRCFHFFFAICKYSIFCGFCDRGLIMGV